MMCCSVRTKQRADMKHDSRQTRFIAAKKQNHSLMVHYHILAHPHVIFMSTAGTNDGKHKGPFVHINVTDKNCVLPDWETAAFVFFRKC